MWSTTAAYIHIYASLGDPCYMYLGCILIVTVTLLFVQAITVGFFAEFPQPVKDAAEAIVNARYVYVCMGELA